MRIFFGQKMIERAANIFDGHHNRNGGRLVVLCYIIASTGIRRSYPVAFNSSLQSYRERAAIARVFSSRKGERNQSERKSRPV